MKKYVLLFTAVVVLIVMVVVSKGNLKEPESAELIQETSDVMTMDQLVKEYAQIKSISEEEAEKRINSIEGMHENETGKETYRILPTSEKDKENLYDIIFYAETEESEQGWKIKKIAFGEILSRENDKLRYLGDINFWIRGEREIEYSIDGDLYKISDSEIDVSASSRNGRGTISFTPVSDKKLKSKGYLDLHGTKEF